MKTTEHNCELQSNDCFLKILLALFQVLDFSGNNLQILPREVFSRHGLLNLQKLKLAYCNIGKPRKDPVGLYSRWCFWTSPTEDSRILGPHPPKVVRVWDLCSWPKLVARRAGSHAPKLFCRWDLWYSTTKGVPEGDDMMMCSFGRQKWLPPSKDIR